MEKLGLSDEQVASVANVPVELVQKITKEIAKNKFTKPSLLLCNDEVKYKIG